MLISGFLKWAASLETWGIPNAKDTIFERVIDLASVPCRCARRFHLPLASQAALQHLGCQRLRRDVRGGMVAPWGIPRSLRTSCRIQPGTQLWNFLLYVGINHLLAGMHIQIVIPSFLWVQWRFSLGQGLGPALLAVKPQFNMLKHPRRASVLRFPRRRTLNPKPRKPKTPKPKTLKPETLNPET